MRLTTIGAVLLVLCATAHAVAQPAQKIIFDTDFAFPPQDDAMALFFVLNSPELDVLTDGWFSQAIGESEGEPSGGAGESAKVEVDTPRHAR